VAGRETGTEDPVDGTFICFLGVSGDVLAVRSLTASDLPQVMEVQRSAYVDALLESEASFASKLRLPGSGARGAFDDGTLSGYLFCHPWTVGTPVPLNASDLALPHDPDCLYIHDLAVRADRRGRGLGDRLVVEALGLAERSGLRACALVAVQVSRPFWERHGFLARKELEYGIRAVYMVREREQLPSRQAPIV